VKAFISKRAARAAERIDARWRKLADHPNVFASEFREAIELLETTQSPGSPCPTPKHRSLKRVLLPKSRCHLYFEVSERKQVIQILEVWDGRRGRSPKL
jgi:hypothetical protein